LGQVIRLLLKNLSLQAGGSELQMQNVKGELFFDAENNDVKELQSDQLTINFF